MNKYKYNIDFYEDGYLILNLNYDNFLDALEDYVEAYRDEQTCNLWRIKIDENGKEIEEEHPQLFKETWE